MPSLIPFFFHFHISRSTGGHNGKKFGIFYWFINHTFYLLRWFLCSRTQRSKLCHDPIHFHKLFFICIWKITKLKLRLHRLSQIPEINLHDNIVLCKYLKSEIMRCVGSFTSWVSQSILLISLWAKSAI